MISLSAYFMGRDAKFASELTHTLRASAEVTVERANRLLGEYAKATGDDGERGVNSGWRPAAVNAVIKNAAKRSLHMTCEAIDIADDDGSLDAWLLTPAGQAALVVCELWLESPAATPRWCHVQTRPPGSGRRVFRP